MGAITAALAGTAAALALFFSLMLHLGTLVAVFAVSKKVLEKKM